LRQEVPINRLFRNLLSAALLSAAVGCALPQPGSPVISLEPSAFKDLAGWSDDQPVDALTAFRKSCRVLVARQKARNNKPFQIGGHEVNWVPACDAAMNVDLAVGDAARAYFEKWFKPHAILGGNGDQDGLLTGYYEPELRGARKPSARYKYPLYGRPGDLVTVDLSLFDKTLVGRSLTGRVANGVLAPYPDRKTIDNRRLELNPKPLVWVDNAVDAFFLHIQGSGRIKLDGGGLMRVGYAASNGHPYTAIGRTLVQRGAIQRGRASMQSIRAWLAANPDPATDVMMQNARYIFFRELEGNAPVGAQGVELTAGRSLAVDRRAVPLGAPLWLETRDPLDPREPYNRLMIAQDVGHAIKGGIRGDIFFGHGPLAARRAGLMNQRGRYFILLPRPISPGS
jgi:membrane-bound lytic murein transglycosylase A